MIAPRTQSSSLWLYPTSLVVVGLPFLIGLHFVHERWTGDGPGRVVSWVYLLVALGVATAARFALRLLWDWIVLGAREGR